MKKAEFDFNTALEQLQAGQGGVFQGSCRLIVNTTQQNRERSKFCVSLGC